MTTLPTYLESAVQAIFADHNLVNIQQHEWEMRTFLTMVLSELKPKRTVELGTYKGFTGALLSLVTAEQTITVDVEAYGVEEAQTYAHHLKFFTGDATKEDTARQVVTLLDGPIDLLFIDDGHYFEQIKVEYDLWKGFVRPGGWIVFHDINPLANIGPHGVQPPELQVTAFWNQLEGRKQEIIATPEHASFKGVIPHGGLGILRV